MAAVVAHNRIDLVGEKYGRLTVVRYKETNKHRKAMWLCLCDCGNEITVDTGSLRSGNGKSCGCWNMESLSRRGFRNDRGSKTYRIWQAMLSRCRNKNVPNFDDYGGRGITVCERWFDYDNFVADMGKCPDGDMSIERKDNDAGYSPDNCKWATRKEQSRNRRNNRNITFKGKSMILKDWADKIGINQSSLAERLEKWPLEKALTQPKRGRT